MREGPDDTPRWLRCNDRDERAQRPDSSMQLSETYHSETCQGKCGIDGSRLQNRRPGATEWRSRGLLGHHSQTALPRGSLVEGKRTPCKTRKSWPPPNIAPKETSHST